MNETEKILDNCSKNLLRGRAVATGIGIFLAVFTTDENGHKKEILLRKRIEKGSLYNKDLSGKYELPGGGVEITDFPLNPMEYQQVIFNTLSRELVEETGYRILFSSFARPVLMPAWLYKDGIIDLAFVAKIHESALLPTKESAEKLRNGEIAWIPIKNINVIENPTEIVSPRMRFLINRAIEQDEKL